MEIKDQAIWDKYKQNNSEGYGLGIISFAERWADEMEKMLVESEQLNVGLVAKAAEEIADTEGITGFMYGAAVKTLSDVWEYGEDLRRWHNRKCQIGSEGDEANASGGVLNPALLTISV